LCLPSTSVPPQHNVPCIVECTMSMFRLIVHGIGMVRVPLELKDNMATPSQKAHLLALAFARSSSRKLRASSFVRPLLSMASTTRFMSDTNDGPHLVSVVVYT